MSLPDVSYGITKTLPDMTYDDAVSRTTDALKAEGFGVLTTIDLPTVVERANDLAKGLAN